MTQGEPGEALLELTAEPGDLRRGARGFRRHGGRLVHKAPALLALLESPGSSILRTAIWQ